MKKLLISVIVAIGFYQTADAGPVTWSFFETAIVSCNGGPTACVLPPQPFVLMTLTLPGPTSAGTAEWAGEPSTPVYTGDNFVLSVIGGTIMHTLTSAFTGNPGGTSCSGFGGPGTICDFDISWSETAGNLTAVNINFDTLNDNIGGLARPSFGLTGGGLASDFMLGGCTNTQCVVAGFWQSDLAVPEPMSAAMLLTGLLGTCLASLKKWTSCHDLPKSAAR